MRARLAENIERVRSQVDSAARTSGRTGADVVILAAAKYVDADVARQLVEAGVPDLAESRLEHLRERQVAFAEVPPAVEPRWHFIGRLQSRQAPEVAARCAMLHALCTDSAARRLAGAADACAAVPLPEALVQVNVAGDPGKDGLAPDEVESFLERLPPAVKVSGFMTMPGFAEDPERSRPAFAALRELRDRLAPIVAGRHELLHLSMGTSQDATVAVEEGATHVRLGRILYAGGE